jgi:hypothetical protein
VLQQLLDLLRDHPGQLSQDQICDQLGISPAGLQSMLEILVRKGKISPQTVVNAGACRIACEDCPITQHCELSQLFQDQIFRVND